jgi:hypothetical protein
MSVEFETARHGMVKGTLTNAELRWDGDSFGFLTLYVCVQWQKESSGGHVCESLAPQQIRRLKIIDD